MQVRLGVIRTFATKNEKISTQTQSRHTYCSYFKQQSCSRAIRLEIEIFTGTGVGNLLKEYPSRDHSEGKTIFRTTGINY